MQSVMRVCLLMRKVLMQNIVFQRPLCWGKDEGCRTEQENRCCAAKKCRCVSVTLSAFTVWSALKWTLLLASSRFFFLNELSKLQTHVYWCIFNHRLSIHFTRKTKKNKQKSKFLFAMQIQMYFDLQKQFDWTFWV